MSDTASAETLRTKISACTGRRVVAYYPALAQVCGGAKAAVMLSQLLFWSEAPFVRRRGGWLYKSVEEMFTETGLTKNEQQTARRELLRRGLIEARLKGIPRTWYYRVALERLVELSIGAGGQPVRYPPDEEPIAAAQASGNLPNAGTDSGAILAEDSAQLNRNQRLQQRLLPKVCIPGAASDAGQPGAAGADTHTVSPDQENFSKSERSFEKRLLEEAAGPKDGPGLIGHPAIRLVKEVTGRYPLRAVFGPVIAILGNAPDEARFREVHEAWVMRGYNASNLQGQLGWYRDGIPAWVGKAKGRDAGQPKPPSLPPPARTPEETAKIQALLREAKERADKRIRAEKRNQEEKGV